MDADMNASKDVKSLRRKDLMNMMVLIYLAIGAIIFSLWCSNERKILQDENQNQNNHNTGTEEIHIDVIGEKSVVI